MLCFARFHCSAWVGLVPVLPKRAAGTASLVPLWPSGRIVLERTLGCRSGLLGLGASPEAERSVTTVFSFVPCMSEKFGASYRRKRTAQILHRRILELEWWL